MYKTLQAFEHDTQTHAHVHIFVAESDQKVRWVANWKLSGDILGKEIQNNIYFKATLHNNQTVI